MQNEMMEDNQLNYHRIGGVIRKYRKERDLKLLDLSALTGIKSAMLSKIENGRIIPTIPALFTIIQKLGISAEAFFSELSTEHKFPGFLFIPKGLATPYEKEEGAIGFSYFSILEHRMDSVSCQISLLQLSPASERPAVTTAAFEFVYVLNGSLKYQLGELVFDMSMGDALFFDGNIAHVPMNVSKKEVSLLVVYLFTNNAR